MHKLTRRLRKHIHLYFLLLLLKPKPLLTSIIKHLSVLA
ncbi:MAG: hypothetical protein OFPI_41980 [Osedax symbiont Rs2]|nr:MAG: hypothetical protein OFPI_41980 [Osedax symbiont Rs2]